jgi:type I restriction enzyme S subunit
MIKEKGTPQIRFSGFNDTWEQRKLGDVVQIERGGSPRPIDDYITDSSNGLNWVKIGDAPTQGHYITKTAEKIKPEGLSKTREVHPGDLILSNSMSFGKPYVMGIDGCIHDGWLLIRDTNKTFDLTFLCHLLGTSQMLDQYRALAAGSTVNNLNKELVGNTVVTIPKINEQRVLGQYLEELDKLITLHQSKYDKLTKVKKSMLEKMFPKNGSNVPEIRFKGFTEAWEQRKLGDMMTVTSVKRIHQSDWTSSGVRFLRARDIVASYKNEEPSDYLYISKEKYNEYSALSGKVKIGDLLVTGVGTIGVPMLINDDKPLYFKDGNIIWFQNENKINGDFLYYSFIGNAIQCFIQESAGTGTVGTYTIDSGKKTPITLPTNNAEQQQIGHFFRNLDNLITLHQRKLEKLKNIKKACLEKMFV